MRIRWGKEYELEIKENSGRGDGVARTEGFAAFVPRTKTGDEVKAQTNPVGPGFARGEIAQ